MAASPEDSMESSFFRLETEGDVAIVRFVRPSLSEEDNVEELGLDLIRLVDQLGYRRVLVSLEGVGWMTSSILGKLIHLHRHLQRQNGEMMICDIGRDINDVLSSSRLNTYFKISPTPEAALSEWQADS